VSPEADEERQKAEDQAMHGLSVKLISVVAIAATIAVVNVAMPRGHRAAGVGRLALIVRGADTDARQLTPESAGLYAYATGFQAIAKDDHDDMAKQFAAYDALHAYCQARVRSS
jgi:hypothetical protein